MSTKTKKIPQIPWARHTKVLKADGIIRLKSGHTTIEIETGGELIFSVDSKSLIEDHMERHKTLTEEVQEWFEKECDRRHTSWAKCIEEWIQGKTEPRGVKEWRPGIRQGRSWVLGYRGHGNTYNEDQTYWWGKIFEYTHFVMSDGREGLVILWHGGGDVRGNYDYPEVWIGSVDEFMDGQYERGGSKDPETIISWNRYFENGILWAYDQHDLFEYNDLPQWALEAIDADPWLLWPDLVDKLIPITNELDKEIQQALRLWIERRRMESEKATGQKRLWPEEQAYSDQPEEDQPWAE